MKELTPRELLQSAAAQLRQDFEEIRGSNPHFGEGGAEAEQILAEFLRDRLPRRFDVQSGVVIGANGAVSSQTDLIVYDALDSPVYRKGPRVHIVPRDNVAAVIEVKSKLNKEELRDASVKVASVKSMRPSPISLIDQPVTFSSMIMANTLGCVFAYDSYTSLDTLADNLREINEGQDSDHWIDMVTVLGKGSLSYVVQLPLSENFAGGFGGPMGEKFPIPPIYIHLTQSLDGDLAINQFFVKLMAHLIFFRRRTTLDLAGVLGSGTKKVKTIQGYQYNLQKRLVPVEESHQAQHFKNPQIRFNLYSRHDRKLVGQVCLLPWQDGAVITCTSFVAFDPQLIFQHYFSALRQQEFFISAGRDGNLWFSYVLPISEEDFIRLSEDIHPDLISVKDLGNGDPPPLSLATDSA
jgi:Domain of unknown function (DUF6602)